MATNCWDPRNKVVNSLRVPYQPPKAAGEPRIHLVSSCGVLPRAVRSVPGGEHGLVVLCVKPCAFVPAALFVTQNLRKGLAHFEVENRLTPWRVSRAHALSLPYLHAQAIECPSELHSSAR